MGTGDGRFVLAHARRNPDRLVVGIDANASRMVEASARAARPPAKGGLPNALFVVSSLEGLPQGLVRLADLVTVHFPWGTLLAAAAGRDRALAGRLAALLRPAGELRLLLSSAPVDGEQALDPASVVAAYRPLGLVATEVRPASRGDAAAAASSWGKRLLANARPGRTACLIRLRRPSSVNSGDG